MSSKTSSCPHFPTTAASGQLASDWFVTFAVSDDAGFGVDLGPAAVAAAVPAARVVAAAVALLRPLPARLAARAPVAPLTPTSVD